MWVRKKPRCQLKPKSRPVGVMPVAPLTSASFVNVDNNSVSVLMSTPGYIWVQVDFHADPHLAASGLGQGLHIDAEIHPGYIRAG